MRAQTEAKNWLGFAALALSLGATASCGPQNGSAAQTPPPPAVTVAPPAVQDVVVWEEFAGRFQAVESVEVRPQISGRLVRTHFVDGQMVKKGDTLFTIDPAPAQATADQARARAAEAQAALELAQNDLDRAERLRAVDAISGEEFDQRQRGLERARAAANAAQAALRGASVELGYTTVRAPIAGRVSDRRVDPGNVVVADQTVLTTVVSQNPIHFEFSMDPSVAQSVPRPSPGRKDGAAVAARTEGEEGFPHQGRLDFVDNQVDPRTGVVRARAVFENANGRFTAGQFGRLRVARGELDDALLVPETAISSDQTRKFVLVVGEKNMVEPRPVEVGPSINGQRVVTGLDPQARVIVNGAGKVFPGMPVTPQAQAAEASAASGG